MAMSVEGLHADLTFGARVSGVTRSMLEEEPVRAKLQEVFEDRGVIVFEDVEPSAEMHVAISMVFGPLKEHPVQSVTRTEPGKLPGVIEIATGDENCIVEINGKPLTTYQPWHFDHAYNDELNRAGVLRPVKIASEGGQTGFADGIQMYRDMDPVLRERAENLRILYNLDLRYSHQKFGLPKNFKILRPHGTDMEALIASKPRAIHPAVWTRSSGEKVFHMTPYGCQGIVGDESPTAFALLSEIWVEAMRVVKPYHHEWRETDMVIWDNWRVLHEACGCNPDEERIVHRSTIKGDYGLGRFESLDAVPPS